MKQFCMVVLLFLAIVDFGIAQMKDQYITYAQEDQNNVQLTSHPVVTSYVAGLYQYYYMDGSLLRSRPKIAFSKNGGVDWGEDPGEPTVPQERDGILSRSAWDRLGKYYCVLTELVNTGQEHRRGVYCYLSEDLMSWNRTMVSLTDLRGESPFIAVDRSVASAFSNRAYVVWTNGFNNDILFRYSTNQGSTWQPTNDVVIIHRGDLPPLSNGELVPSRGPSAPPANASMSLATIAIRSNGDVFVAYYVSRVGIPGFESSEVRVRKSTDGGASFGEESLVAIVNPIAYPVGGIGNETIEVRNIPSMVVLPSGDALVSFCDAFNPSGSDYRPKIRYFRSEDAGANWGEESFPSSNSRIQFFPSLVVTQPNVVSVCYMDSLADGKVRSMIATSFDAGKTLSVNRHVSEQTFDPRRNAQDRPIYYYMGSESFPNENKVIMGWTDERPIESSPNQNIFISRIIATPTSYSPSWNTTSIPTYVGDFSKAGNFPGALPQNVHLYTPTGYQAAPEPLVNNRGYFTKFETPPGAQTLYYVGSEITLMGMPVKAGFNIIGSISKPVLPFNVGGGDNVTPPNTYMKYTNGGYTIVTQLEPGWGHWVKVIADGTLTLQDLVPDGPQGEMALDSLDFADKFVVSDEEQNSQTLYVTNGGSDIDIGLYPLAETVS